MKILCQTFLICMLFLSSYANASLMQESHHFLTEIGQDKGFWFYQTGKPYTEQHEKLVLAIYPFLSGEEVCSVVKNHRSLFQELNQKSHFYKNHTALLFTDGNNKEQEQKVRRLAKKYRLPLIVIDSQQRHKKATLNQVFKVLSADFRTIFLINPKKRQVILMSRSYDACRLEMDFFFRVDDAMRGPQS